MCSLFTVTHDINYELSSIVVRFASKLIIMVNIQYYVIGTSWYKEMWTLYVVTISVCTSVTAYNCMQIRH